jgi:hypothetical protein
VALGLYLGWRRAEPSVDFTGAASLILADNPSTWPSHFHISGMSFAGHGDREVVD